MYNVQSSKWLDSVFFFCLLWGLDVLQGVSAKHNHDGWLSSRYTSSIISFFFLNHSWIFDIHQFQLALILGYPFTILVFHHFFEIVGIYKSIYIYIDVCVLVSGRSSRVQIELNRPFKYINSVCKQLVLFLYLIMCIRSSV